MSGFTRKDLPSVLELRCPKCWSPLQEQVWGSIRECARCGQRYNYVPKRGDKRQEDTA